VDDFQHRGIGSLLLEALTVVALEQSVTVFVGHVLVENLAMRAILEHAGARPAFDSPGVLRFEIDLPAQVGEPRTTPVGAVLRAVGAETAVLGGASMGTATALHAAVRAPERVEGLVLTIPPTAWGGRRVQAGIYRAGATVVARAGLGTFVTMGRAAPAPKILTGELAPVHDAVFRAIERLDS